MPLIPRRPNDPGYGPLGNIVALAENRAIGTSSADAGVLGASNTAAGVYGYSLGPPSAPGAAPQETGMSDGVLGVGKNGVHGQSTSGNGVLGESASGAGVLGSSTSGFGIEAQSTSNWALFAKGTKPGAALLQGNVTVEGNVGILGTSTGPGLSVTGDLSVTGNVSVSGDVMLTGSGSDCAEYFDSAAGRCIEPGSVVVLDCEDAVRECSSAYDKRVAGVISGAGSYRPAIVMGDRTDRQACPLIALTGKVYCKVDADQAPVAVGDLLTTSPTYGHAMKATDAQRSFGAVIGKALRPLCSGRALIPILVALQ
jgi:hypothetical protein